MCLVGGHADPPLQRVTRVIAIRLALSTTDAQWCHSVTCPVGTHDLCVRPCQRLFRQILRRRDCNDNGRTDRASLHWVTRVIAIRLALSTTDAQIVRPYTNRHVMSWGISVLLRAPVVSQRYVPSRDARSVRPSPSKVIALAGGMYASLHWATRLVLSVSFFVSLGLRNNNLIEQDRYGDTFFRGVPH